MAKLLVAKRRNLMFELEDCDIREAVYRTRSVYLCPECGCYVRPHTHWKEEPRFKHVTASPAYSYSGRRKVRR